MNNIINKACLHLLLSFRDHAGVVFEPGFLFTGRTQRPQRNVAGACLQKF
jgi:hypothetical protein